MSHKLKFSSSLTRQVTHFTYSYCTLSCHCEALHIVNIFIVVCIYFCMCIKCCVYSDSVSCPQGWAKLLPPSV